MPSTVAVLATLDTKAREAGYLVEAIRALGASTVMVNTGRSASPELAADFEPDQVAAAATVSLGDDDTAKIRVMKTSASGAERIVAHLVSSNRVQAVIAIGGGQGSWIASTAMRALPVGLPKVLVSTAGRDAGQFTQYSDIIPMFSITDVAGLNPLLRGVFDNAARSIVGMAVERSADSGEARELIAVSVYGITTAGANVAMDLIGDAGWEPVSFHANGVGGPTMEAQIAAGTFTGVLDWSITETADEVLGGVCSAGPSRLTNAGRLGIPQLIVPGGMDVVNFGAPDTMPSGYRGRRVFAHTAEATLLRTNVEENRQTAALVAGRLNVSRGPVEVVIPLGGFSALSGSEGPLCDPDADMAFANELTRLLNPTIRITTVELNINDPEFAGVVVPRLVELMNSAKNLQHI